MDKKIDPKDALFLQVNDIANNWWVINKKEIVSAGASLTSGAITRIVLTSGLIIDTYMGIGDLTRLLSEIEHKSKTEDKS